MYQLSIFLSFAGTIYVGFMLGQFYERVKWKQLIKDGILEKTKGKRHEENKEAS